MITRKIGKLIRGKATPVQVMLACVLGTALGFVPGFRQGPGLAAVLVLLLIVLNANLFLAGLATLLGKVLCLALLPASYALGRVLLDGPTEGVFRFLVNAPVLALFGFEHYATTGGLVIGLAVGSGLGWAALRGITAFRRRMARLEEGSPRYAALSRRWWVRLLTFLFIGRRSRKSYQELLQRGRGNPIRPLGAVLAVLVVGLLVVVSLFFQEPIVTAALQRGLERANGATVDIEAAELDLREGRLVVRGFAMADAHDLDRDLLRAARIEADVSGADLLRRRLALDRVALVDASTGEKRARRASRVGPPPAPVDRPDITVPDAKKLGHYVGQARRWRERLAQVRRWLEPLSAPDEADPAARETRSERVARRVEAMGYARVKARHLMDGAPSFAVYELVAEGVRSAWIEGETLAVRGTNLSTHPHLLETPPGLTVRSSGGTLDVSASFAAPAGGANAIELRCRGLSGDAIGRQLAVGGTAPISGGTVDVDAAGTWTRGAAAWIDLPLSVTVKDATLAVAGSAPTPVERLVVPIGVRGPLDDPRIVLDDGQLADALVRAGAGKLAERVQAELGGKLPEVEGGVGDAVRKGLGGLLGDKKKEE